MLVVADVALFSYVAVARGSSRLSASLFRDPPDAGSGFPPSGYSAAGNKVAPPAASENGWAIRYASPHCEHCRADEARWSGLKTQLIKKGYHIYEIPPTSADSYPANAPELAGETQISFVDVGWMKRYRPMSTPTILLFNGHGRVIWTHVGEMNQDDDKSALQAGSLIRFR
jgi:hypothetical protein